ncbi:MAG: hypothetical protein AAGJ38_04990 [Planctomycetota bacterium]
MPPIKLQDPEWHTLPEFCASCGYSLIGLNTPGTCPECGLAFDEHTLVMIGIPRRGSTTSPLRRLAWGIVIGAGVLWLNCIGFVAFEPMIFLVLGLGWLVGLIALLATGKRERSATQPLIFTAGGFGLASDAQTQAGRTLQPWSDVNNFRLTRIGAQWFRLQIGLSHPTDPGWGLGLGHSKLSTVKFEAGVRCNDEHADRVCETLTHHLRRHAGHQTT